MKSLEKPANTSVPIHELLSRRWSPRSFTDRPIPPDEIRSLLEAARWAPSCFNEQPWVFILATKDQNLEYERLLECLVEGNRDWARHAYLLLLTIAKTHFSHNDQPNRHAYHDVGLAVGNLVTQATALNLVAHQMAGIHVDVIRNTYALPSGHDPVTAVAVGYQGHLQNLSEALRDREHAPRARNPLKDWVFSGNWGQSPNFL